MVYSSNITTITTSGTLSTEQDVYIVDASGGNITLTLPDITGDGMNYELRRIDTSINTVDIARGGSDLIDTATSISLNTFSSIKLHSLGNVWYRTGVTSVNSIQSKAIFSTAFQNNPSRYIEIRGAGSLPDPTQQLVCYIYYPGTTLLPISSFNIVLGATLGTPNGTARLVNYTNGNIVIASIAYNITGINPNALSTNTITVANLPTGPSILSLTCAHINSSNRLAVYSLTLQ
jgi:hypothetical protein